MKPQTLITTSGVAGTPVQRAKRAKLASVCQKLLGVSLAALLVLPIAEATQPAEAGKKFKTITKSISSNGQIDIPDAGTEGPANPYPTTINVDDFAKFKKARIEDVNLTLKGFDHTLSENVDVMLVHGNRRALVMADAGNGVDVADLTITLDDQADQDLPENAALTSGVFRPADYAGGDPFPAPAPLPNGNVELADFNGTTPDGEWRLFVHDDANTQIGQISGGWELEITAKVKNEKKDKKGKKGKAKKDDKDE